MNTYDNLHMVGGTLEIVPENRYHMCVFEDVKIVPMGNLIPYVAFSYCTFSRCKFPHTNVGELARFCRYSSFNLSILGNNERNI